MQQAQTERVKAAGSLLKRLSFAEDKVKRPKDPDSLPGSPVRGNHNVSLIENSGSSAGKYWKSSMATEEKPQVIPSRKLPVSNRSDSSDSETDEIPLAGSNRRASLVTMLSAAKKTVTDISLGMPKKRSSVSSDSVTPANLSEHANLTADDFLRRGQAAHQLFSVFSKLEIPSRISLLRFSVEKWKKPDLKILQSKISPIWAIFSKKIGARISDAFWRLRVEIFTSRKLVISGGIEKVVEMRDREVQTEIRRQFDTLLGLGKIEKILGKISCEHFSDFFERLKQGKKRQMEIAFLRAVISELKRREN